MNTPEIFAIDSDTEFEAAALWLYRLQYDEQPVYREFCDLIKRSPTTVATLQDIPFLPISFFKTHEIIRKQLQPEIVFTSSGTTGMEVSRHPVASLKLYEESFLQGFTHFYGRVEDYVILALLPSYLERSGSSLIYMAERLINDSKHPESGFYLNELEALALLLRQLDRRGQKTLLIGVSFALLDLVENHQFELKHTVVMETGGMKGRRKEMIRKELHDILSEGFGLRRIHSEYGMTELLSQAYSKGDGIFHTVPWMRILIRETEDPMTYLPDLKTGGINVIDLANRDSCAFIATQDLGKRLPDGSFEILGRFDHADVRGCNLMVF